MELANTKHNFFSHHVWNEAMLRVVDKKIKQEEDEVDNIKKISFQYFVKSLYGRYLTMQKLQEIYIG